MNGGAEQGYADEIAETGCGLPVVVGWRVDRGGVGPHGPLVRATVDVGGPVVPHVNRYQLLEQLD